MTLGRSASATAAHLAASASSAGSSATASCSYAARRLRPSSSLSASSSSSLSSRALFQRNTAAFHTSAASLAKAVKGAAKGPAKSDDGSKASAGVKLVESSDPNVSACPPGTVLSGLGIFKDKAEPVALPDEEYPAWLWSLVETSSTSSSGGLSITGGGNMTKGELRVAQKKAMKELRAKAESAKRAATRAAIAAAAKGARQGGAERAAVAAASATFGEEVTIESAPQTYDPAVALAQAQQAAARDEARQRAELRKANKAKIKSNNFLSAA
ncbi:hypothetical protein CF326_g5710 [Tilletia indica]|uniref:Large ribosomal subunit protein mL54 n=1 Tax=Tilletia indica TaxID=43049 RepID=A0A177TI87_9BASI|nr:hypothetical protein CF326_g5710 [Tilletia indica]KAE8260074.1 hypothetical protein A4X13_0g585 [Tilletia indica]